LEIVSYKIQSIVYEEIRLDMLNTSPPRWFRVEEIPKDELEIGDDELLIPVAHFSKEIYSGFGIPFLLKVREAEPFSQVKGIDIKFHDEMIYTEKTNFVHFSSREDTKKTRGSG
jgi:hypothetical protein